MKICACLRLVYVSVRCCQGRPVVILLCYCLPGVGRTNMSSCWTTSLKVLVYRATAADVGEGLRQLLHGLQMSTAPQTSLGANSRMRAARRILIIRLTRQHRQWRCSILRVRLTAARLCDFKSCTMIYRDQILSEHCLGHLVEESSQVVCVCCTSGCCRCCGGLVGVDGI